MYTKNQCLSTDAHLRSILFARARHTDGQLFPRCVRSVLIQFSFPNIYLRVLVRVIPMAVCMAPRGVLADSIKPDKYLYNATRHASHQLSRIHGT